MLEQIDNLWAAVRQLQADVKPLLPEPPPPPVPGMDDPEKAKAAYEAAEAEVKNQKDHAALMIKWAEDNAAKAKAIMDKSVAEAKAREQAEAQALAGASHPPEARPMNASRK